jgi:predicted secreted hydrolase
MLYRLRLKDGSISSYSSGTFVDATGKGLFLRASDFRMEPGQTWRSEATGAVYPIRWQIDVPSRNLRLDLTTPVASQELVNRTTRDYWEGTVQYTGTEGGKTVEGVGYLEMTGYERTPKR